jgi:ribosomal protein L16 Arg81 hydroxylase
VSKSWQEWTAENLGRNCDPVGIVQILMKNNFPMQAIQEMMGSRFPSDSPIVASYLPKPTATPRMMEESRLRGKRASVAAMQASLRSLRTRPLRVGRVNAMSPEDFVQDFYSANRPVLLSGMMSDWSAPQKWTPDYLKAICGTEIVEIMAARDTNALYEIDDAPHRKQVSFSQFVDMVNAGGRTNDYYLTARNNFFLRPGVQPLLNDFTVFSGFLKPGTDQGVFFWYGPAGTVTPLHHDEMNIFMAQVTGRKRVILVPPNEVDLVYNHRGVYSQVDAGNPDYARFPKYADASIHEVELGPGEVLFLPVGWWHYVQALDVSITITFNNFKFPNEYRWQHPAG